MPTELAIGPATVLWTGRADGHLGHNPPRGDHDDSCCGPDAVARRTVVKPGPWHHVTQVHGHHVVVVDGGTTVGVTADGIISTTPGLVAAIATADCASIALVSPEGVIGAVHAGWKGLWAGVIRRTAELMQERGAKTIVAALGPCIHPDCYEFGADQLDEFALRWGPAVRSQTSRAWRVLTFLLQCERSEKLPNRIGIYRSPLHWLLGAILFPSNDSNH